MIPFIQKMEVKAPDQWLLAYIDVETTGLLPGHHDGYRHDLI